MDNRDHFEVYNDTDTDCPAGGVCMLSGGVTTNGVLKVVKPTADSLPNLVVPNFFLPARSVGSGTLDARVILCLDTAGGGAVSGEEIGSQSGSFLPRKGKSGFVCVGGSSGLYALASRAGNSLRVRDSTGSPSYYPTGILEFVGTTVTQPSPGVTRVEPASGGSLASGESELGSNFTVTSAAPTYQDTGLSIDLPSAGTYKLGGRVRGYINLSVTGALSNIAFRLYDNDAAAEVPRTQGGCGIVSGNSTDDNRLAPVSTRYATAIPCTLKVQAYKVVGTGVTGTFLIVAGSNVNYMKVG